MDFKTTNQFLGMAYLVNNDSGAVLRAGDWVIVHPTKTSFMRVPYLSRVVIIWWEWVEEPSYELSVMAMNGYNYTACLNDYAFKRLEKVEWNKNLFQDWDFGYSEIESPKKELTT
jgi:hypothetical protein